MQTTGQVTEWSIVSSVGSFISFIDVLVFIFIVWESLTSQQKVTWTNLFNTSLEWDNRLPADFHDLSETGALTL